MDTVLVEEMQITLESETAICSLFFHEALTTQFNLAQKLWPKDC